MYIKEDLIIPQVSTEQSVVIKGTESALWFFCHSRVVQLTAYLLPTVV